MTQTLQDFNDCTLPIVHSHYIQDITNSLNLRSSQIRHMTEHIGHIRSLRHRLSSSSNIGMDEKMRLLENCHIELTEDEGLENLENENLHTALESRENRTLKKIIEAIKSLFKYIWKVLSELFGKTADLERKCDTALYELDRGDVRGTVRSYRFKKILWPGIHYYTPGHRATEVMSIPEGLDVVISQLHRNKKEMQKWILTIATRDKVVEDILKGGTVNVSGKLIEYERISELIKIVEMSQRKRNLSPNEHELYTGKDLREAIWNSRATLQILPTYKSIVENAQNSVNGTIEQYEESDVGRDRLLEVGFEKALEQMQEDVGTLSGMLINIISVIHNKAGLLIKLKDQVLKDANFN